MLYPLVFQPIFKEHVWGGRKLEELYAKALPPGLRIGESWEISDRPEGVSVVTNGPLAGKDLRWLMQHHAAELLGSAGSTNGRFPLLVKLLDCREAPSVQVHPPDDMAARSGDEPKTEIWYITQAEPDARLTAGLVRGVKRFQFERKLGEGRVLECLHTIPVQTGDVMFVPSGRVHTVGGGIVLCEIQQNSNTTYRLFDWDRLGPDGKPRELHIEQGLAATDYDDIEPDLVRTDFEGDDAAVTRRLADTPWFQVEEWQSQTPNRRVLNAPNRPIIVGILSGKATVAGAGETVTLGPGQFCLIPASLRDTVVETDGKATCLLAVPSGAREVKAPVASQTSEAPRGIPPWRQAQAGRGGMRTHHAAAESKPRRKASSSSRLEIKLILGDKLNDWPLVRLLVLHFWFRMVVIALVLAVVLSLAVLAKVWPTTPSGFRPRVRVSLLDKVQAYMLRNSAEQAVARGDHEAALLSWRNAFANDMGNPALARGVIRSTTALDPIPTARLGPTVQTSDWLLRLAATNRADLELVCAFYDKAQLYGLANAVLEPFSGELTGRLKPIYVKCLFFQGSFDRYKELYAQLSPAEKAQPDMALIHAAYQAGWGRIGSAPEVNELLDKTARQRGPLWFLANRLEMSISSAQSNPDRYRAALDRLQEAQLDNAVDNADYWMLLVGSGRRAEAVRLAQQFVIPPRNQGELVRLATVKFVLGLKDDALKLMQAFANSYPASDAVWSTYANLLLEAKDWTGLRAVALQMRLLPMLQGRLVPLSYYHEGRADLATAQVEAARRAFDAATNLDFQTPEQSMAVARSLLDLGYATHARSILDRADTTITNRLQYLDLMSRVAIDLRDEALMMSTSKAAYELDSSNIDLANRYAAALLIRGERPGEAVALTLGLLARMPDSNAFRINHALALLMNNRLLDAALLLNQVDSSTLQHKEEFNSYYQALFELRFKRNDHAGAWEMADRMDWSMLFPTEANRLGAMRSALPPRTASPGRPAAP
ncbi:MAG TPA: hypothetical protein PKM43_15670 [Verrucomicrobiota bacterium]|nr:hypothetical protein [Verrucomicrobiota bacterium]HRZ54853.1 hypothetical protein [Candidatus Paceibacterota bacterium]